MIFRRFADFFLQLKIVDTIDSIKIRRGEEVKKGEKLLEIGFGEGHFCRNAQKLGYKVTGIELKEPSQKPSFNAIYQDLLDAELVSNYFDVVVMIHSLEHLEKPLETLKEIHRILKPKGILWIDVPNIEGMGFKLFKEQWYAYQPEVHLTHFTEKSLVKAINMAGFRIEKISYVASPWFFLRNFIDLNERKWLYVLLFPFVWPISYLIALFRQSDAITAIGRKEVRQ